MPDTVLDGNGSGQTGIVSAASLVTQIARPVGGEGESEIRTQALDCLNRVRIELNQHDLRFMKTTEDPITLVDGQETYGLSRTFRKPSYAVLIDSAAVRKFTLDYYDDAVFAQMVPDASETGIPLAYTLRNDFADGLVTVYPTPDASTASTYRLQVEYFARIEAFSDTSDPVSLPEEITNVLVIGGQAYMLREREKASPATVQAFVDYQRVKGLLISDDRRVVNERSRMRLIGRRMSNLGSLFFKVS